MGGAPIPFVQWSDRDETFRVDPEAERVLGGVLGKLAVVCVAGPYRTGKSFLLNRLIGTQQRGFQVGGDINACTKGIWLWRQPIQVGGERERERETALACLWMTIPSSLPQIRLSSSSTRRASAPPIAPARSTRTCSR